MADPSIKDLAYRGLAATLGGPVDIATMVMRPFGYSTPDQQVVGGSEWIGKKMEDVGLVSSARSPLAEFGASMIFPGPDDLARAAAFAPALIGSIRGAGKVNEVVSAPFYLDKAKNLGVSKVATPVKAYESKLSKLSSLGDPEIAFLRSNSGATGYFLRGGEVIDSISARDIGMTKIPSGKDEVLSILQKKADDEYGVDLDKFVASRNKAIAAKERNKAIAEDTAALRSIMAENDQLIKGIHKNQYLDFRPISNEAFDAKSAQHIYKSPSYGNKPGSEYKLIMVDGRPAYARQSDHWGNFSARSSEDFEKWNDYNWNLPGTEGLPRGERRTGYIFLDELSNAASTQPLQWVSLMG